MKRMRFLGALAAVSAAFLAAAGGAQATSLTSPEGTAYTGTLKAQGEGHAVFDNPIATIECGLELAGEVKSHGVGATAIVPLSILRTFECTNDWHFTTVSPGVLEIHWTSGRNGTLTSTEATVESTRFGINCRYATNNTDLGTLTGGSPATINLSASIPFHSGSIFCGSGSTALTGGLTVTTPATVAVDV